ncbi:MAG: M56 family metallopeptidase, partial [Clostridiales bacterium]|nr:M56 family metallopeptidase [Clostridiales bacterium]
SEREPEQVEPEVTVLQIAAYVWLTGASVMAIYSVVQYLTLRHRLVGATPYREEVYLADHITTPFVLGVLRPRVYLPSETPEGERAFIIAHERHHIRRHDPLWKLLGYAALCLHWFNPLVWLAFALAGKDMEMSCDEAVIRLLGEDVRADYSQALLRLATHKRIVSGMPLAFGEGDTKSRVRNMAKWKKPKIWVSVLCVTLCLVILAACALNPKQNDPLKGVASIRMTEEGQMGAWDLHFTLPKGYIMEKQKRDVASWTDEREVIIWGLSDGVKPIGGVMAFPIPKNFSSDSWDWLHELDLPEWQDETLGYSAGGAPGVEVSVEFFSDVPPGQERTVLNEHNLYFYEGWIYDLWFDELTVKPEVMEAILDSVSLGEPKPNPTIPVVDMPYKILEMPAGGYDYRVETDGSISFLKEDNIIGGIVAYPIPEGVYDPNDDAYLCLEDVGVPDLENPNLTMTGMFAWGGSNGCTLTVADNLENPTVQRTHYFRFTENTLYDFWLDDLAMDEAARSAFQKAVVYQEPVTQQPGTAPESEMSEEEKAFSKCQAVMMGLQDIPILIQTECRYQNTPEKNYIETLCDNSEIGFLRVTTTADGLDHAQLYVNDRYYTNAGSETNPEPIWVESEAPSEWSSPWLGNFNFIRHYVTYVDTLSDGEKTSYMFRINALFEDTPDAADFYLATFHFDADGNFIDVYLQINPGRDDAYTLTESIVSTDEQVIVSKIDREYQRAIG